MSSSSFPSSQERTVASSLLLLRTTPPSPSFSAPKFRSDANEGVTKRSSGKRLTESSVYIGSDSSFSSVTDDNDVVLSQEEEEEDDEIKSRSALFSSATALYCQMKFKIVRKIRSKVMWASLCSTGAAVEASPGCMSGEASSCLSSSSSGVSSARSLRYTNRIKGTVAGSVGGESHRNVGSPHLHRRGEAILKLLSHGGSSEVKIRQMLGDSPDTSKALRM